MRAGYHEPTSVFVHNLPIISRHDGQKQDVISEGDAMWSLADDRHFKWSQEGRTQ